MKNKIRFFTAAIALAIASVASAQYQHPEYRGGGFYHNGYYGGYSPYRSHCDSRCAVAIVGGTVLSAVVVNEIERNRPPPNVIYVPVPPPEVIYVPSYRPQVIIIRQ